MPELTLNPGSLFDRALNKIWPQQCFICGQSSGKQAFCLLCAESLPHLPVAHCPMCALPVPEGQLCGRCQQNRPHFDKTLSPFFYDRPISEILLSVKAGAGFRHIPWLAHALSSSLKHCEADCIIPMPLHRNRLKQRGFNQSVELSRPLVKTLQRPLWTNAVIRQVDTPHQMGLVLEERRRNMRKAFLCQRNFKDLKVLVIDDVMTTGSTLNELAKTLKAAGAIQVSNVVVARALPKGG